MKFLKDLAKKNLTGKVCLLRVDFNVESDKDALKLESSLPTMKWLLAKGARLVVLSHRGRPKASSKQLVVSSQQKAENSKQKVVSKGKRGEIASN